MIEKSFFIIRTNPTLTGNVKLVVSSDYKLYLESFNANEALRNQRFKHYLIKMEEYWKEVLPDFFSNVENSTIFGVRNLNDISETYTDYKFQFDDTYFSGAQFVEDNFYTEEYEYTAPLYLKRSKLPTDFIILRVDGLGSISEDSDSSNFRERIINQLKYVTSFDLTENSDLGVWLKKNFVDDVGLPEQPLILSHGDVALTQISGIDIKASGWVTKYLNLFDIQSQNSPIFKTEEYFNKLWENNNLIYPDIMNFKFLFDDTPATPTSLRKYSINRYLGFYVDEKVALKSVSPFKGFDLNIVPFDSLEGLDAIEANQIPYLKENTFIQEIDGRLYSFDPIKNGWKDGNTYWIEYNRNYYRLEKIANTVTNIFEPNVIIGDFLYRVVASINIERSNDDLLNIDGLDQSYIDSLSPDDLKNAKRVLINDLGNDYSTGTTYKDRLTITNEIKYNNITGNNIIENSNTTLIKFKRNYETRIINGISTFLFTVEIQELDNTFTIENFDEADLHLFDINGDKYVIKKYPVGTPNLAGKYYLNTDWAVNVNTTDISAWINNGNVSLDPTFYKNRKIETVPFDSPIPFFTIYRINFTDIKDFDFDRVESNYTRYEYEQKYNIKQNVEPKFYAKEFRENPLNIYTIKGDKARRIPILDENNRPLNLRDQRGELNYFTGNPYTDTDLYYTDLDGSSWQLLDGVKDGSNWYKYELSPINLNREFYREEGYIWRLEDANGNVLGLIDFKANSDKTNIYEGLTWGANKKNEISDIKQPLPVINSVDPNEQLDTNYIPVSSEYINSDELWELRDNDLTAIWDKNQSVVKWGALNSIGAHDYPYRLNYSLEFGMYNNEPNPNTNRNFPEREQQNLDYFYRFNLLNKEQYQYYTLHINDDFFNIDAYLSKNYDYFEGLFKSDQITSDGLELTNKYSLFINKNDFADSETIFRGVKYLISDVTQIIFDDVELQKTGTIIVDDIITTPNTKYSDYKFTIIFGKKKSDFSNDYVKGTGNSNMGIDFYLNDYWKNVVIHLYINTDETIQLTNPDNNQFVNAETSEIDLWYRDTNDTRDTNPTLWDALEFKVNNFGINLRPRDFKLLDIINFIKNKNFDPKGEINKEKINFIHIYDELDSKGNPLVKVMNWENTDFVINIDLPSEVLIKEKAFITTAINNSDIPDFDINNSLENRKITEDVSNNPNFTSDGLQVDSVNDINSFNNYPIAKTITQNTVDTREAWELENDTDPSLFRYDGVYAPIFKTVPLFRPLVYKEIRDNKVAPILGSGNWKFYDPNSSKAAPNLSGFGQIEELLFSKCNNVSSILKIQNPSDKEKSVYPMVDEYGYDFDARYMFAANFEPSYYYISKKIEVPINSKKNLSGFTIHYDGVTEYLRIPDQEKFNQENYLVEDANYQNFIQNEPSGERRFYNFNINGLNNTNRTFTTVLNIVKGIDYNFDFQYINYPTIEVPPSGRTNVYVNYEFNFISSNGARTKAKLRAFNLSPISNPLSNHDYIGTGINMTYSDAVSLNLTDDYTDFDTNTIEIKVTLVTNFTSSNDKLDMSCNVQMVSLAGINFLDIETDNYYLQNNNNNQLGDVLFGSFMKKENESLNIVNYPAFSKRSTASKFTVAELNTYDKSNLNSLGEKLWKEFSGLSTNKRPGRVGVAPYDYATYPIPKNWNGYIYIDILNRLRPGAGTLLKNAINPTGHYGYFNYADPNNVLNSDGKFDRATLYHFLEYGSLPMPSNPNVNDLSFGNSRFGAAIILNEFYKLTGFQNFFNRGFNTQFAFNTSPNESVGIMRVTNDTPFSFEPDRNTHLLDGKKAVYVGEQFGSLTKPFVRFQWYMIFRDVRLDFSIVPQNGNVTNISIPLIDPTTGIRYNYNDVIKLINNELTTSPYQVTLESSVGKNVVYKIASSVNGSYYNFDIVLNSRKDFTLLQTYKSSDVRMVSEKYTKTSLRDNRRTGRITSTTIEFWIKADGWERDWETILYKGDDSGKDVWLDNTFTNFTWAIGKFSDTDKLAFKTCHEQITGGYVTHTLTSELEINDGNWHHVACVSDFSTMTKQIWIDGELDKETSSYLEPLDTDGNVIDRTPLDAEILAQFVERRNRFVPGAQHPNIGVDSTLANKIRLGSQDSKT
ncbi:MAG: Tenacibaculum phage PTm1, partial [Bacteroidota bacterium]